jgi:hypothetical protein
MKDVKSRLSSMCCKINTLQFCGRSPDKVLKQRDGGTTANKSPTVAIVFEKTVVFPFAKNVVDGFWRSLRQPQNHLLG